MSSNEPRDFRLARRAYEAFFDESPQVWFEQLGHEYQMKWVRVARAVIIEVGPLSRQPGKLEEAQSIVDAAPRKGTRINYKAMATDEERKKVRTAMHLIAMHRRNIDV